MPRHKFCVGCFGYVVVVVSFIGVAAKAHVQSTCVDIVGNGINSVRTGVGNGLKVHGDVLVKVNECSSGRFCNSIVLPSDVLAN